MLRRNFRLARTVVLIIAIAAIVMTVGANRNDVVQAQRLETVSICIKADGVQRHIKTAQTTVAAALQEVGIEVGHLDEVTPATNERLKDGMEIKVVRVREVVELIKQPVSFETVKTFTSSLRPGQVKVTQAGVKGEKWVRYLVRYEDGKPVARRVISSELLKKPVNKVVSIGSRGKYTSRGSFRTRKVIRMSASAYDPGPRSCGRYATGRTACGLQAGYGVVAVDPDVIPLGTKLYIEGYGYAVAGDKGSSIKGNRIDLGFNTYREAIRFGRKSVIVHILE